MRTFAMPWATVHCFGNGTTNGTFVPRTPWIRISNIKRIRAIFEMIAAQTNVRIQFAFQVAKAENEAPASTVFVTKGDIASSDGMVDGNIEDITGDIGKNLYIRFGFKTWNNSEGVLVCCAAGGTVELLSC